MRDKVRDENKNREELKHLMFFLSLIGLGEEVVGYRKEIETTLAFVLWGLFSRLLIKERMFFLEKNLKRCI